MMMNVAVIGAGTMGNGIAQLAAQAGHPVRLYDTRAEAVAKAIEALERTFAKLVEKGKLSAQDAQGTLARIRPCSDMGQLKDSDLVIEAIIEDLGIKRKLFGELETIVSRSCILATNTSSLSVTAIASGCTAPQRVIGLHFFNPAPLLP